MQLDKQPVLLEVDSGAAYTIMSQSTFRVLWPHRRLDKSKITLRTYSGESLEVLGSNDVQVNYNSQTSQQSLLMVVGSGQTLLGRNWLRHIRLDWQAINQVAPTLVQTVLK